MLYKTPQYSCVREEKIGKIGMYWKLEYTMRVALTKARPPETQIFYGKSIVKKEAKSQAAAAAYFSITGMIDVMGPTMSRSKLRDLVKSTEQIKSSVTKQIQQSSESSGRQIAVLGSSVPLPAPSSLSVSAPSSMSASHSSALYDPATEATVTDQVNMMIKERNEKIKTEVKEEPKEDMLKTAKKELDKFENFLTDLEADARKEKSKKSKRKSRSRSRSRHKSSSSRRRSSSHERGYDSKKYYRESRYF